MAGKGDIEKAQSDAGEFLHASLATRERTYQALARETNVRIGLIAGDRAAVKECIGKALHIVERLEVPVAAWRVRDIFLSAPPVRNILATQQSRATGL
jgi:hypothetical protein